MSSMAERARKALKEKATRLTTDPHQKVDASSYTPPEPLDADVQTGMRPVSRRQYRRGGSVQSDVAGSACKPRADRKTRSRKKPNRSRETYKNGGSTPLTADSLINKDLKEANQLREGKKHIGGLKKGGRAERKAGGRAGKSAGGVMEALSPAYALYKNRDKGAVKALSPVANLKKGGAAKHPDVKMDKALVKSAVHKHESRLHAGKPKTKFAAGGYAGGGMPEDDIERSEVRRAGGPKNTLDAIFRKADEMQGARAGYSPVAVDKAIVSSNRSGRKIGKGEASKIHRLLKGGYASGGKALDGEMQGTRPTGGRKARARGGLLKGHPYHDKTDAELRYIVKDAGEAARSMKGMNEKAEGKYLDQVNDASSILHARTKDGRKARKAGGAVNLTVVVEGGKKPPQEGGLMPPPGGAAGPGGPPMPMPPPPMANIGGPPPMPPAAPPPAPHAGAGIGMGSMPPGMMPRPMPMGAPMPPGGPMPRRSGGRVGHRTYRKAQDMDAGAGSGLGRLEKIDIQKAKR